MKKAGKIYVVYGHSGEYSDSSDWSIAWYPDETTAREHVEYASAREREIVQWRMDNEEKRYDESPEVKAAHRNKWDRASSDSYRSYTGVTYSVACVVAGPLISK